jgi:hypothetical protein
VILPFLSNQKINNFSIVIQSEGKKKQQKIAFSTEIYATNPNKY